MQPASQLADDLAEKLKWFVDYYDQAGIGDCEEGNDDEDDGGEFDGDERFNVRHGRQALERYAAALTALSEPSGDYGELASYDAGLLAGEGMPNYEWWWDTIRYYLNAADAFYQAEHGSKCADLRYRLSDCDRLRERVKVLEGLCRTMESLIADAVYAWNQHPVVNEALAATWRETRNKVLIAARSALQPAAPQ